MFRRPQLSLTDFNNKRLDNFSDKLPYKTPKTCHNCTKNEGDIMGSNDAWIQCMIRGETPIYHLNECPHSQEIRVK